MSKSQDNLKVAFTSVGRRLLRCIKKKKVFCFSYKQESPKLQLDSDSNDRTELGTKIKSKGNDGFDALGIVYMFV